MRERQKLNKHFRTLANKSLNHQRKIGSRLRYQVLLRDKSTCQICGRSAPSIRVHVDHKIPVSWDKDWKPSSNLDDYQVLCEDCNLGKSDMSWIWSI
ncbi:HNH endonuclease [Nostoc sp.]|uniref:HNH endonuclease n=1 Tax=Nostoc sp. TaxID=1180 RepID=UPI003FA58406